MEFCDTGNELMWRKVEICYVSVENGVIQIMMVKSPFPTA
jgi:hypothetical protein